MNSLIDTLEQLIDDNSIDDVLKAIEEICYLKAEHLRSNWQDGVTGRYWENIGRGIDKIKL